MKRSSFSRQILLGCFALFLISSIGCTNNNPAESAATQPEESAASKPETNYTDANHLKQGPWEIMVGDHLWKKEHYIDGHLDGTCYEYLESGEIIATDYSHGHKSGYSRQYLKEAATAKTMTYWEMGSARWTAYPSEIASYLIPTTGFETQVPSADIQVHFNSGELLYEGKVVQDENKQGKAVGLHKVYFQTGGVMAEIDYDSDELRILTPTGEVKMSTTITEWRAKQGN